MARQPVRPRVQLRERQRHVAAHQRGRVRRARAPAPRTAPGTSPPAPPTPCRSTPRSTCSRSASVSIGSSATGRSGVRGDPVEQHEQVPGHPLDRGRVEQVGVVLERADAARRRAPRTRGRGRTVDGHHRQRRPPRPPGRAATGVASPSVLQHAPWPGTAACGWCPAPAAARRPAARTARPGGRRRPARCPAPRPRKSANDAPAVHGGAQHQGVDEEADQPLQLGPLAAGRRRCRPRCRPARTTGRAAPGRRRPAS